MNAQAQIADSSTTTPLQAEIQDRFGVLPNFFRLPADAPEVTAQLWGFAKLAYLDNHLPSLFKERLFVYLSRFCPIRYCIARHVGFLVGRGRPAGDRSCPPQSVEQVIRLLQLPLARKDSLDRHLAQLDAQGEVSLASATPDSSVETALFACATHVFIQSPEAPRAQAALQRALGPVESEHVLLLLVFVRSAHFWTLTHTELAFEDDINELLTTYEALADCVFNDPEAQSAEMTQVMLNELGALRRERSLREELERANQVLLEAQERLQEQDRRKDEWLATLAHELRNPLAPIRSGLDILRMRPNGETASRIADVMDRQLMQMVRLVDDLLDVSRISRGKIELRKDRVDIASVVHQALEAARPVCQQMRHEVNVTLPAKQMHVHGDSIRLTQVVVNLLNNACKFTEPGGQIRVLLEQDDGQALIRVQDSGIGIADDQLDDIFELFTQLDTSLERTRTGLGIGLTLVKQLVTMHGGTVEAHSQGIGKGSEFTVRLPVLEAPTAATSEQDLVTSIAPVSRRILVVDDNHDAAHSLATLLDLMGHEAHCVYDGQAAVNAAGTLCPDVILLDIGLPRLNGYEVASRIRQQQANGEVVIVALTGWGQTADRQRSEEAGFDLHLVKPVDRNALATLLLRLEELHERRGPRAPLSTVMNVMSGSVS